LRIGASDTICKYYLLPYIKTFHNKYPGIKLQIVNRPSPVVHDLVEKGQVEIGIVNILPSYKNEKLDILPLIKSKDIFIASDKYLELSHGIITLDELIEYPLISLGKNSTTRLYFNQLVKQYDLNYEPEIELGSIDLIIEMVKIGLGIGFVSDYAANEHIENESIFQIKLSAEIPERKLGIVSPAKLPLSAAAKAFTQLLTSD
jgi:DNA-binding transcriptional LysR family regulator